MLPFKSASGFKHKYANILYSLNIFNEALIYSFNFVHKIKAHVIEYCNGKSVITDSLSFLTKVVDSNREHLACFQMHASVITHKSPHLKNF